MILTKTDFDIEVSRYITFLEKKFGCSILINHAGKSFFLTTIENGELSIVDRFVCFDDATKERFMLSLRKMFK